MLWRLLLLLALLLLMAMTRCFSVIAKWFYICPTTHITTIVVVISVSVDFVVVANQFTKCDGDGIRRDHHTKLNQTKLNFYEIWEHDRIHFRFNF